MGRRKWYNDLARDTRDIRYLQKVYGPKTPEEAARRQGCLKVILIVFAAVAALVFLSICLMGNSGSSKRAPTPTAAPRQSLPDSAPELLIAPREKPTETPYPFSLTMTAVVSGLDDPEPTKMCSIKGNVSSSGMVYHCTNYPAYASTTIKESEGDRWFCTEEEAIAAGFRKPGNAPSFCVP